MSGFRFYSCQISDRTHKVYYDLPTVPPISIIHICIELPLQHEFKMYIFSYPHPLYSSKAGNEDTKENRKTKKKGARYCQYLTLCTEGVKFSAAVSRYLSRCLLVTMLLLYRYKRNEGKG